LLGIKRSAYLLVRPALDRGLTPVLVTPDPHLFDPEKLPEAFREARRACRCLEIPDWDDHEALLRALRPLEAEGAIVATFSNQDEPLIAQAMLRERYGLPTTPAAVLAEVLHKRRAREILLRNGLSRLGVVPGAVADTWTKWPAGKKYFFKSCFGSGKRGVAGPLDSLEGLKAARADWRDSAPYCTPIQQRFLHRENDEYYLEEAYVGADVMSVEAIWQGGRFRVLGIWSRFLDWPASDLVEMGGVFPWPHPRREEIVALVEAAHRCLGVSPDAGPTHTEVLVKDDRVELCEVNHRFGGDELLQCVTQAIQADVPAALLDWAAGAREPSVDLTPRRFVGMQMFFPPPGVGDVFESMTFPEGPDVVYRLQYLSPGAPFGGPTRSASRVGSYLVAAPSFEEAVARAKALRPAVKINGVSAAY
jgi:hypothetical protein